MVKRLLSTLAFTCLTLGIYAGSSCLVVEMKDGKSVSFVLSEKPVLTFENRNLVINKDSETSYSFENIKNYHFSKDVETAANMFSSETLKVVWVDNQTLEVQNAKPSSLITLTAINGSVVSKSNADGAGMATVRVPNNAGIYVLSAENQSFKIIRKH